MDAESLAGPELASGSGQGLIQDRRAALLTSLMLVKRDYRFDRVLFWAASSASSPITTSLRASEISSHRARPCTGGRGRPGWPRLQGILRGGLPGREGVSGGRDPKGGFQKARG